MKRCNDGRNLGIQIISEGASQSLSELISALQKAACSEDDTCLLQKFGLLCNPIQIVSRFKSNAKYFQP